MSGRLQSAAAAFAAIFRDDRKFWRAAAILLTPISICKGLRVPNLWSATQALINYDHGFVKRGMFGAVCEPVFNIFKYSHFAALSLALVAIFFLLLGRLLIVSRVFDRLGNGEPAVVFLASFSITYLTSLVGYLDIPLGILALILLQIRSPRARFGASLPTCILALLIHEGFLLIFLPVVLFSFVLDGFNARSGRDRKLIWAASVVLLTLSLAVTFKLAANRPMTPAAIRQIQNELTLRANFPLRSDFFDVFQRSVFDNLKLMADDYLHWRYLQLQTASAALIFVPPLLLLFSTSLVILRCREKTTHHSALVIAAAVASFSPVLMYVLGWDTARWDALTCLTSFLVMLLLCGHLRVKQIPVSKAFRNAAVLSIALSMASGETLMDVPAAKPYPFLMNSPFNRLRSFANRNVIAPPQ